VPSGGAVHIEVSGVQPVPHHRLPAKSLIAVLASVSPALGTKVAVIVTGEFTATVIGLLPLPVMVTVGVAVYVNLSPALAPLVPAVVVTVMSTVPLVWSKYWSEASISSIENLIALITVPVPHRRPG
jgi:hypothetical protein